MVRRAETARGDGVVWQLGEHVFTDHIGSKHVDAEHRGAEPFGIRLFGIWLCGAERRLRWRVERRC